jgi:phosphoribosylformylglycinamidine cyclo-ligase
MVLKTEEPGSKQLLAFKYDRVESICYDMINHLINDCIVMGATPLTVQDAIICGKLEKDKVNRAVAAIAKACQEQGCILTGGETSEQPGVLEAGTYVLTSSIVGIVDKEQIIDGSKIAGDDLVLGLEASGLHTNGYTLIRKMMAERPAILEARIANQSFIDVILEPHRCYYQAVRDLFSQGIVKGMAHITGGGIKENLNRILPEHLNAEIDLATYQLLPVFRFLKQEFELADSEMLRTFNMGIGLTMVASDRYKETIIGHLKKHNINTYAIGRIIPGQKEVVFKHSIKW